jgi:hypothetical protein
LVVEMGSNSEEQTNPSDRPDINHYHQGTSPAFEPRSNPLVSGNHPEMPLKVEPKEEYSSKIRHPPDIIHYHHGENQSFVNSVSSSSLNMLPPTHSMKQKVDIAQYHPSGTSPQIGPGGHPVASKPVLDSERARSHSLSSCQSDSTDSREEEIRIAALLGDHMPGAEVPSTGEPTDSAGQPHSVGLAHFMSLRLSLLRLPDRRSEEENALLDIIKRSYQGFSRDANRSSKEIASLLVKDWHFLTSTASDAGNPSKLSPRVAPLPVEAPSFGKYQSYLLHAPTITTHSHGAPISMPPLRLAHTEVPPDESFVKKRRISGIDE